MRWMMMWSAASLMACEGGGDSQPPETDLETVFCDLLENGPSDDATLAAAAGGPELVAEDRSVNITLVDVGGSMGGFATYTPDEAGSFAIGLSADVPMVITDSMGSVVEPVAQVAGGCDALATRYTVPLEIASYGIEFGPTTESTLGFVSEESDDDL